MIEKYLTWWFAYAWALVIHGVLVLQCILIVLGIKKIKEMG